MEPQELLNSYISKLTPDMHSKASKGSWGEESYEDYRVVKAVQQALINNELSSAELDQLIINNAFTPKQTFLIGDIHEFGASSPEIYKDPRFQKIVDQTKLQLQLRREELGID